MGLNVTKFLGTIGLIWLIMSEKIICFSKIIKKLFKSFLQFENYQLNNYGF